MAPELLAPEKFGKKNRRPTQPADVYAFGMVIYEVLTGRDPFYDQKCGQYQFMANVLDGKRPTKPADVKTIWFGSGTWELMEECWKESTERPTTERVIAHLACVAESSTTVGPTPRMTYDSDDSLELSSSSMVLFISSNHGKPNLSTKGRLRLSQSATVTALPAPVTASPVPTTISPATDTPLLITPTIPLSMGVTLDKSQSHVNPGAQILNPGVLYSSSVRYYQ